MFAIHWFENGNMKLNTAAEEDVTRPYLVHRKMSQRKDQECKKKELIKLILSPLLIILNFFGKKEVTTLDSSKKTI